MGSRMRQAKNVSNTEIKLITSTLWSNYTKNSLSGLDRVPSGFLKNEAHRYRLTQKWHLLARHSFTKTASCHPEQRRHL